MRLKLRMRILSLEIKSFSNNKLLLSFIKFKENIVKSFIFTNHTNQQKVEKNFQFEEKKIWIKFFIWDVKIVNLLKCTKTSNVFLGEAIVQDYRLNARNAVSLSSTCSQRVFQSNYLRIFLGAVHVFFPSVINCITFVANEKWHYYVNCKQNKTYKIELVYCAHITNRLKTP